MPTQLIAGDNQNEASFAGGNDGALEVRIGPAGSKATGLSVSSVGDVAALGKLTQQGGAPVPRMLLLPAKATTSGTFIDFSPSDGTGIPSWAKKITVMLMSVSTNGTSPLVVRIGAGSVEATGYFSTAADIAGTGAGTGSDTTGLRLTNGLVAADTPTGALSLTNITGSSWISTSAVTRSSINASYSSGSKNLSGVLDRIRLTTVNGTDTFDAGSISILVEGYE